MNSTFPLSSTKLAKFKRQVEKANIEYCQVYQRGEVLFTHSRHPGSAVELHKMNSITKSVLSLLIGIAMDRGELGTVHTSIAEFLPGARKYAKDSLTLEHLLTMTPGIEWLEMGDWGGKPYPMMNSEDWVEFVLTRPTIDPPGTLMIYNSGCSHLLSAILQQATGLKAAEYAERHLFGPLGIADYYWPADPDGINIGGFGLELDSADLLKLGRLMLDKGRWNNAQIVSENWVEMSTLPRYHTYSHIGSYAYHWWVMSDDDLHPSEPYTYFAMGYGGQNIYIVPEHECVVTFAANLYKDTFHTYRLFKELIL
ncbi:serine hydrolase domain-containing protein [Cohnella kolymensis]|uniref:serine hydrolase domain-containing protein n=1 Tax=Cohnella kolymensis TaxID=1590652 RepID=UPI000697A6AC|nr:serine hydrolase [Cohnella kolymensis]